MITTGFHLLEPGNDEHPGTACYVAIHRLPDGNDTDHFQNTTAYYRATCRRQFERERMVQVKTNAAALYSITWEHLSFRWDDGVSQIDPKHGRLVMPETEEERTMLEKAVTVREHKFRDTLILDEDSRIRPSRTQESDPWEALPPIEVRGSDWD